MNSFKYVIFLFCLVLLCTTNSYSFEDEIVHPLINENSVYHSLIDTALKENGLSSGINEKIIDIKGIEKEVVEWIKQGGTDEDRDLRSFNHFHDPTLAWQDAELWGWVGTSSVIWAQKDTNDASWLMAREYYHQALLTGNEDYYVSTFKTLGQLMHLVSDMAVPAHVRDDAHLEVMLDKYTSIPITHFEVYTKKNIDSLNYDGLDLSHAIFDHAIPGDYAPISALWDIDLYDGKTNPAITLEPNIGLAEYTNANFLSEGTIFNTYLYPAEEDTDLQAIDWEHPVAIDAEDGKIDNKIYIKRADDPDEDNWLAAAGYHLLDEYESNIPLHSLILDDEVYRVYADKLVPRAVGYSATLLDYFFRGKLQVLSLPIYTKNGYYSLVGLKIKNITESEEGLTEGSFSLTMLHPNPNSPDEIYTQAFADPDLTVTEISTSQLAFNEETEIYFYLPYVDLEPEDADSISFMLAYRGGLGNEKDAVIGKHFKPEAVEIFVEEWDSLAGNYPWQHIIDDSEPSSGTASNSYAETTDLYGNLVTTLVKENVRYAGYDNSRSNRSDLDLTGQNFAITPNTYIQFKIDEMKINEQPPSPPETTSAWQFLSFTFSEGSTIQMSVDGQGVRLNDSTYFYDFWKEHIWRGNIYSLLQKDSSTPDLIFLEKISLTQVLDDLDDPSSIQHEQYMEIDSIRLFEAVPK